MQHAEHVCPFKQLYIEAISSVLNVHDDIQAEMFTHMRFSMELVGGYLNLEIQSFVKFMIQADQDMQLLERRRLLC